MLSGRRLDILDPSPMDVEIIDIAHGLARVSRWNGQTKGLYPISVAQHSTMVERFVSQNAPKLDTRWRLAALLHDAPEYVIGDMITPFKYALGGIYREIESHLSEAIHIRFGLPAVLPEPVSKAIKRAEQETKAKQEKVQEIKKLHQEIQAVQSEMTKLSEHLVSGLLHYLGARVEIFVNPMPEAHQPERVALVLRLGDELVDAINRANLFEHLDDGFVGAAVRRSPQRGDAGSDTSEWVRL